MVHFVPAYKHISNLYAVQTKEYSIFIHDRLIEIMQISYSVLNLPVKVIKITTKRNERYLVKRSYSYLVIMWHAAALLCIST